MKKLNLKKIETAEELDGYSYFKDENERIKAIQELIDRGAIPKSKLVVGKHYYGNCRNSTEALWNGEQFVYSRLKFGNRYDEAINHFEDDDGYDVFIPIKEL